MNKNMLNSCAGCKGLEPCQVKILHVIWYIFPTFRLGKMYRYTVEKLVLASLEAFATVFYKNMKAEPVSLPKTPL